MKRIWAGALAVVLGLLAACGGGGGTTKSPPSDPATFTAAAQSSSSVKLDWSAVGGATGYTLERKTGAATYTVIQASLTATTFTDSGLAASTKYNYRVKAVNAGGSSAGKEASVTTQAPPAGTPPSNPASFTATATSSTQINLAWTASAGATSYSLERKTGSAAYATVQASLNGTTFQDSGLMPSTAYTYRVKAVNVNGSSAGMEASATTQAPPAGGDFTLSPSPATLSLAAGGTGNSTLTVSRTGGFASDVTLSLEGSVVGAAAADKVSGAFTPNPVDGSSTLALTAGASMPPGDHTLTVRGISGALNKTAPLTLKVTAPKTVLLVDDDCSANNQNPANPSATPSASDAIFRSILGALSVGYNEYVVPCAPSNGPSFAQMKDYQTAIGYTGDEYGGGNSGTVSSADEAGLKAFLNQGNRKVIIFADSYIYGLGSSATWISTTNTFLADYIGAQGAAADKLNGVGFTASGVSGTVTDGLSLDVASGTPIATYTDPINPKAGTDTLLTAPLDPDGGGSAATGDYAIATGRKNVGTSGTSTMIYLGFSFENIVDISNDKQDLMQKLLSY